MLKGKSTDFCTQCRKEVSYHLVKETAKEKIKDKIYNFEVTIAICDECGAQIDVPGLMDLNIKSMDEQYRRTEDLVSVADIENLMAIYNLGKAPLSLSLGFGEITITRYLAGQMPSKEYSNIIKKALSSPSYMISLLNANADKLGETAYKKAMKSAKEIVSLFSISNKLLMTISYIFEQMQEVTPLALQKLLYFIQGIHLVLYGKALYKEDCMAWVHGPVYEGVYNLFKDFKYNPIEDYRFVIFKNRFEDLNAREKRIIDVVLNSFGKYSGKVLEEITHNEKPWQNARSNYEPLQPSRNIITKREIKEYFLSVKNEYGMDSEKNLNAYIENHLTF